MFRVMRQVLGLLFACLFSIAGRGVENVGPASYFGVNYYAGFFTEYRLLANRGLDHKAEIRRDVAHFRRLGLNSIRLHTFDVEFSDGQGGFVDNHHVELLDYLIGLCSSNGISTILTPIAWWHEESGAGPKGFSALWTMPQMTSDRRARSCQTRFLREFLGHVNRYTGHRYADDSAIIAIELINEPHYPPDWPDDKVTEYIDSLVDAVRSTGCRKPLFYNCWEGRNVACGRSKIDGVSGNDYPTGLVADRELPGSQLGRVVSTTIKPDASIRNKMKMIYEFDSADVGGAYMYPAMAREFRHEGCFAANQFQYDTLATADRNAAWKTHHLNLVYTPAKALSLAIAAEVFRRSELGCDFRPDLRKMSFGPFSVDSGRNLSQMVTDVDFLYTADTETAPPHPEMLNRIWGVGSSSVASASGNGIYFLDRAARGVWRLQLYPNVLDVRDPYCGERGLKHAILPEERTLKLCLEDLGDGYCVRSAADGGLVCRANGGSVKLRHGDYILESVGFGAIEKEAVARLRTADFNVPECLGPSDWEFLDPYAAVRHGLEREPEVHKYVAEGPNGEPAYGVAVRAHGFEKGGAPQQTPVEAEAFERLFGHPGPGRMLCVTARATDGGIGFFHLTFTQANGVVWGWDVPLDREWRTVRIPVAELKPFWPTKADDPRKPDLGIVRSINYSIGRECCSGPLDRDHGVEIASVRVEF